MVILRNPLSVVSLWAFLNLRIAENRRLKIFKRSKRVLLFMMSPLWEISKYLGDRHRGHFCWLQERAVWLHHKMLFLSHVTTDGFVIWLYLPLNLWINDFLTGCQLNWLMRYHSFFVTIWRNGVNIIFKYFSNWQLEFRCALNVEILLSTIPRRQRISLIVLEFNFLVLPTYVGLGRGANSFPYWDCVF